MKMKTIKTDDELHAAVAAPVGAERASCELIIKDGNVIGARVGRARFETVNYGLSIHRELDHEETEKHRVRVDHPAFPSLNRYFDGNREADRFAEPYRSIDGAVVNQGLVTVQVDDQGRVLAEVEDGTVKPLAPQSDGGDEIPF